MSLRVFIVQCNRSTVKSMWVYNSRRGKYIFWSCIPRDIFFPCHAFSNFPCGWFATCFWGVWSFRCQWQGEMHKNAWIDRHMLCVVLGCPFTRFSEEKTPPGPVSVCLHLYVQSGRGCGNWVFRLAACGLELGGGYDFHVYFSHVPVRCAHAFFSFVFDFRVTHFCFRVTRNTEKPIYLF